MLRLLRYLLRLPWLLLHLLVGLPVTMLLMLPPWRVWRLGGMRLDERAVRCWSSGLMRVFGFRVKRYGDPLPGGVLLVANHVSWVDIEMIHSQVLAGFVAKAEIARWPLVGWMAARGHTIFHQRGNSESLGGVMTAMVSRLNEGCPVAVFPEGRTRDGRLLGPFHARTLSSAVEANVPVQPVAIRYGKAGDAQAIVAFHGNETFVGNFLRLLGEPSRPAEVHFLEPVYPDSASGRKQLADRAREQVARILQVA